MFLGNLVKGLAIAVLITLMSCQRITPAERKLVGTWEFTGLDATGRIVFRGDHIIVELFRDGDEPNAKWVPGSWGTWRMEGDEILTDSEMLVGDYSPSERRVGRIAIAKFERNRLVRADGRSDFYRVRLDAERRSQVLALLCVIGSVTMLSACVTITRRPLFGKAVAILLVAAALAVAWSTSTLLAELAQTGTAIMSPTVLSRLGLVSQVAGVLCVFVLGSGFVSLVWAVKRQKKTKA